MLEFLVTLEIILQLPAVLEPIQTADKAATKDVLIPQTLKTGMKSQHLLGKMLTSNWSYQVEQTLISISSIHLGHTSIVQNPLHLSKRCQLNRLRFLESRVHSMLKCLCTVEMDNTHCEHGQTTHLHGQTSPLPPLSNQRPVSRVIPSMSNTWLKIFTTPHQMLLRYNSFCQLTKRMILEIR